VKAHRWWSCMFCYSAWKGKSIFFVLIPKTYRYSSYSTLYFSKKPVFIWKVFVGMMLTLGFGIYSSDISTPLDLPKIAHSYPFLPIRNFSVQKLQRFFIHCGESVFNFLQTNLQLVHSLDKEAEICTWSRWPPIWNWSTTWGFAKLHLVFIEVLPRVSCRMRCAVYFRCYR